MPNARSRVAGRCRDIPGACELKARDGWDIRVTRRRLCELEIGEPRVCARGAAIPARVGSQLCIAGRAFIARSLFARALALSRATRLMAAAASTVSFNRNWPASERIGKLCGP